ncbi:hypothetical protein ScPMuIL_005820 [Solemya velum]
MNRKSGQLNLSGRSLTEVPDSVWRLNIDVPEEATSVSLDNTEDRWWDQTELTKLILASNWLTALSDDIRNFSALTVLDLHDNRLESLPDGLSELKNLQKLDISHNRLTSCPDCVCRLCGLVSLQVAHNQMESLGDGIGDLYQLQNFTTIYFYATFKIFAEFVLSFQDISNNQLGSLPHGLGYLTKLIKLNVSNNKITEIPPEIGCMNGLKFLDLTHNQVNSVPEDMGNLMHLEQLYIRHNQLQELPALTNCVALKELHLGNNIICEITLEHLQQLKSVSVLDLRDNKIPSLPEDITVLQVLERLDLTNNNLTGLPYSLGTINTLKSIVVDGNPMKSIRRDIVMRGTMELKKYLRSRLEVPVEPVSNPKGVVSSKGQSGVIGGGGDGINAHEVGQFKNLDYSGRQAIDIPEDVLQVAVKGEVTSVNLSKNNITSFPVSLVQLTETLKELMLGRNKLTVLHSDIGKFGRLTMLDLRNNALSDLPCEVADLQELREIVLSCNRFMQLPTVLYKLKKLEILFASDNKIEVIDADGLCQLPVLGTLDLQNNSINQVPPELGNCLQLKSLQISGNLFRNPRPAILAKGTPALLEYLRSRIVSS